MDIVSPERRSAMMSGIRGQNTKPEITVRRLAHRMGYRFRLHRRDLPGTPDLVFPGRKKVVFVHGCFWHRHPGCRFAYNPKSRTEFWQTKFASNVSRDERVRRELNVSGWDVLTIWECETADSEHLTTTLRNFLENAGV
ncbi:MAG TPA: very short patch repair endonuclease [Longimicrobium sp.]|nr:very short patch repair endonuclease [Longimicrobium sp.]